MKVLAAIAVSVGVHALLAVGLWIYFEYASGPEVLATLDLTSVELSFAEEDDETAASVTQVPVMASETPKPREEKAPEMERPEDPLPPDADSVKMPDEEVEREQMVTPEPVPVAAPKQGKIDAPPSPKRTIRPEYPKGARQRGEQGAVVLEIKVNAAGMVDEVKIVSSCGFAELDEAAEKAARSAKFNPAKSGRKSVASVARLTLEFKLKN